MLNYVRQEEYNEMTPKQLQRSYILLKKWLHKEYEEQMNAMLMLQESNCRIPVSLQDEMLYEIDSNYNLICKGFDEGRTGFNPVTPTHKLTLVADILERGDYGSPEEVNAPFCTEIRTQMTRMFPEYSKLKKLYLHSLRRTSNGGEFSSLHLVDFKIPEFTETKTWQFRQLAYSYKLKLPKCADIAPRAFSDSDLESIFVPNCRTIGSKAFSKTPKLNYLDIGSNTVYFYQKVRQNTPTSTK